MDTEVWLKTIGLVLVVIIVASLAPGLAVADRYLSRNDKIRMAKEGERLLEIRDAILRFRMDTERFPGALAELVPGYLSEELLELPSPDRERGAAILWDPGKPDLRWSAPFEIRGIFLRKREMSTTLPDFPVVRDPLTGKNVFRRISSSVPLPDNAVIVEPELFRSMTYGWQIEEQGDASGSCYLHIREGAGDSSGRGLGFDPRARSGDFYNIDGDRRAIEARCDFMAPEAGTYHIAARTMAHRSRCSNIIRLDVNDGQSLNAGRNGSEPFVWLWHSAGQAELRKGVNTVSLLTYQDDVKIDQMVLSRDQLDLKRRGSWTFTGGYRETLPHENMPPVTMSVTVSSLGLQARREPDVSIYLRRNLPEAVKARLLMTLDLPAGRTRERWHEVSIDKSKALLRLGYDLDLPRPLPRREYLLRCRLFVDSKPVQERTVVFLRNFEWHILSPVPFMEAAARGPVEGDTTVRSTYVFGSRQYVWRPYDEQFSDHYCLMDFGRMHSGRTYHAIPNVTLYAYTEIDVEEEGAYLLKAMGDDNLVVWINGGEVVRITQKGPPIRTARQVPIRLLRGRNRILFRLNQKENQWQAGIRIRTADDQIARIVGVPSDQWRHIQR